MQMGSSGLRRLHEVRLTYPASAAATAPMLPATTDPAVVPDRNANPTKTASSANPRSLAHWA